MRVPIVSRVAAPLLVGALAWGCGAMAGPAEPDGEPIVRGPVESITHHATGSGILVRAGPGSRDSCGIATTADGDTRFLRRGADGRVAGASLAEVAVGDTVEVYVTGPVAESCPLQGRASTILLLGDD
jgi:hypothetical protein